MFKQRSVKQSQATGAAEAADGGEQLPVYAVPAEAEAADYALGAPFTSYPPGMANRDSLV